MHTPFPDADNLIARARRAMLDAGFQPDFAPAALAEIRQASADGSAVDASDVRDLSALLWSSIDNESSRDLDQVEYAEELASGDVRLLIGIADVDVLVPRDSAIDRHAAANATSVYAGVATFPMLPPELSTDRTSLVESQGRLALVIEMIVGADGDVRAPAAVYRARLRNAARLTYPEIGAWLDDPNPDVPPPASVARVPGLAAQLRLQARAAARLRAFRQAQGALTFGSIEAQPVVQNGRVAALRVAQPNAARDLIESFMIAANVAVSRFLRERGVPAIRRVVRAPERWARIRTVAAGLGATLPESPDARALSAFLAQRRSADPAGFVDLSLTIVKLLGPGEYVVETPGAADGTNEGHFGLAVGDYTHSTAPNRRFADLIVQRLLKAATAADGATPAASYLPEELAGLAAHCTERENAAKKVERLLRKIAAADLLGAHLGETFDAIVTGASPKGIYVRLLRPPAEGRVVRGERGLEVGATVRVRLLAVDRDKGFIDFARV